MHSHQGFPWEARQEKAKRLCGGGRRLLTTLPGWGEQVSTPPSSVTELLLRWGRRGVTGEARDTWGGGVPEGESPHFCPVILKPRQPAFWMSRELCVHRAPVHQYDHLDSGLGAFPAPGSWFPPLTQPFSTLRPAAAHPPRGICFPNFKTKLPGG